MNTKLLISALLFWFPFSVFCCESDSIAMNYAEKIREWIVSGNVDKFRSLSCVPVACIGDDDIEYIYGSGGDESFIRSFLKKTDVKTRVFGPFVQEEAFGKSSFSIVYFDPSLVSFNENGHMNRDDRRTQWNKGYIETLVTCKKGKCAFHRTPFYYGAHIPWMEDY